MDTDSYKSDDSIFRMINEEWKEGGGVAGNSGGEILEGVIYE